ncbi:MAG: LCP family protein [Clostridia bacterium]|nr:LCP family protein [Clostridia bacterium]
MGKHSKTKEEVNNKKSKKNSKHIGRKILIVIVLLLAIAGGLFAKRVYDLNGNWLAALMGHNKETVNKLEKLYILVMGESTGMSDTIIVTSYDPKTGEASMLSIPRDTFIGESKSRATTSDKINALYNGGAKPEKTMEAVNKLTGLNIKNYILVDTKALVELVDTIGGLEFEVPMDMKYDDDSQDLHVNLKEGKQKLSGDQVEQLVRFRHNSNGSTYSYEYGIEDFGRMKTQRAVMVAIAKQTIKFKNVKEIGHMIDISKKYVKTNMDLNILKNYIPYIMEMDTEAIKTEQLPGQAQYINGISFFLADDDETKEVVDELFFGKPKTEDDKTEENNINND